MNIAAPIIVINAIVALALLGALTVHSLVLNSSHGEMQDTLATIEQQLQKTPER